MLAVGPAVDGMVMSVAVTEGQEVKPGDLLFVLDNEPFRIAVDQARAQMDTAIRALSLGTSATLPDDTVIRRRDGERRRAHCSISPVVADSRNAGLVIVFRDTTAEHELKERLHHAATHDALTSLPNRQAFDEAFQSAIRKTARGKRRLHMLALLDLDGFKAVNDGAGHAAGDEVLKAVGA